MDTLGLFQAMMEANPRSVKILEIITNRFQLSTFCFSFLW